MELHMEQEQAKLIHKAMKQLIEENTKLKTANKHLQDRVDELLEQHENAQQGLTELFEDDKKYEDLSE